MSPRMAMSPRMMYLSSAAGLEAVEVGRGPGAAWHDAAELDHVADGDLVNAVQPDRVIVEVEDAVDALLRVDDDRLFHEALEPAFMPRVDGRGHRGDTARLADEAESTWGHSANPN